jgi:hypothetical protein
MAIYEEFEKDGEDYLDNIKPKNLQALFVRDLDADSIPNQAMDTLHTLFDSIVADFSKFIEDPTSFKEHAKGGANDPVKKLVEIEKFKNAVRFVLVYRIAAERKTTLAEAKKERDRIARLVMDNCKEMLMGILMNVSESLIGAAGHYNLDGKSIRRLSLRIEDIFDDGLVTRLYLDGEPLDYDDDIGDLLGNKDKPPDESFNPMFG